MKDLFLSFKTLKSS